MTPTKPLPAPIVFRKYDRIHHTCARSCVQHTRCERVRNTRIIHATDHVLMKPSAGTISPCLVPQMQHRSHCEDVKRPATCSESPLNCVLAKEKENMRKLRKYISTDAELPNQPSTLQRLQTYIIIIIQKFLLYYYPKILQRIFTTANTHEYHTSCPENSLRANIAQHPEP